MINHALADCRQFKKMARVTNRVLFCVLTDTNSTQLTTWTKYYWWKTKEKQSFCSLYMYWFCDCGVRMKFVHMTDTLAVELLYIRENGQLVEIDATSTDFLYLFAFLANSPRPFRCCRLILLSMRRHSHHVTCRRSPTRPFCLPLYLEFSSSIKESSSGYRCIAVTVKWN